MTKSRTCETDGCGRVSGDARFCRTCRERAKWDAKWDAEVAAPLRRDVTKLTQLLVDEERAAFVARAERDDARRDERIARKIARQIEAERDAVKDSHDRMAKICDGWAADCSDLASRVRTLSDMLAREEAEHAAFREGADAALEQVKRERDDWKGVAKDNRAEKDQFEAAANVLTTRLRLSWAVSGVLAIGLAVAGMLLWGVMS